jgi:hypothetical protein
LQIFGASKPHRLPAIRHFGLLISRNLPIVEIRVTQCIADKFELSLMFIDLGAARYSNESKMKANGFPIPSGRVGAQLFIPQVSWIDRKLPIGNLRAWQNKA